MLFDSSDGGTSLVAQPLCSRQHGAVRPDKTASALCYDEIGALVTKAQTGDGEAQSELVRRYRARVAGFVHKMIRRHSAVEDVAQTVMIRMIRRLPFLREPKVFESWLFRMARNEVFDTIRRAKCRPSTTSDYCDWPPVADETDDHSRLEIKEAAEHAIQGLAHSERKIILLVIAGHSYRAIAAATGLTATTVKIRVYRIRLILRPRMLEALGESIADDQTRNPIDGLPRASRKACESARVQPRRTKPMAGRGRTTRR